jgi:hypothetical protein
MSHRRALVFLLVAAALVSLPACGKGGRKPVYPVHGKVLDGSNKPAVGALVVFHPVNATDDDPNKPRGYVEEDGSFALTTYDKGDGAPEGEYVATVEWRPPRKTPFEPDPGDKLNGRYSDPKKSPHRFKVEKGAGNELPPIKVP